MATIRRAGFGTVFELEDSKVGIGTDAATHTLQALGNIRSEAATDIGISTLTTYQGFTDKEARFTTGQIDNQSQSGSTSGEIVIDGDVTVSSATTFTSGPQNLTITDTFTLPLGDTNSRETKPTIGSLRFNQDFATLEFYTGNNWATVNTFTDIKTNPQGRGRAVFTTNAGGNKLDFVNIPTLGNAVTFGALTNGNRQFGCASETRGLWAGGYNPSTSNEITYITIASEGDSIDFGDLNEARRATSAASSSTRGVWFGGYSPAGGGSSNRTNTIQYVEIATLGNAKDFGDLTSTNVSSAAAASPTRCIFSGGYTSPFQYEVITTASTGNATRFGDMLVPMARHAGCSNSTRGVFGAGRHVNPYGVITAELEYITIASEGKATFFGDITVKRNMLAAASNQTRGLFAGGYDSPVNYNIIDFITFSSVGNAIDFGDCIEEKRGTSGLSDSHGGLGGF